MNANTEAHRPHGLDFSGPAWINTSEYPSLESNEFAHDLHLVDVLLKQLETANAKLKPFAERVLKSQDELSSDEFETVIYTLIDISEIKENAITLIRNMATYINCARCVNGEDTEALKAQSHSQQLQSRYQAVAKPSSLFLARAPEKFIEAYLKHPNTQAEAYQISRSRAMNDTLLSEAEETLLSSMRQHGPTAWGNLYDQVSGQMRVYVRGKEMGLAQASGLLRDTDETVREESWRAIQTAWKMNEAPAAAILNGLAGWRLEEYKRRSHKREVGFLDFPLHDSAMRPESLNAMMTAVEEKRHEAQAMMFKMASVLGKKVLAPWDLLASPPSKSDSRRTFKEGLHLIRTAFDSVDPNLADFVDMMEKNHWIEGRVMPAKRQGAFCTGFAKSRTPRVFQTYMGSISDIRTLAHELGHAYHSWVMRDMPLALHHYPMTLAETASIFAETAFADYLRQNGTPEEKREIEWQDLKDETAHYLNIPARFDFEKSFYERRKSGFVPPSELNELNERAWRKWYGETLTETEKQFWMTKLHFSISGVSFYNYPYTFGALFSSKVYGLRKTLGSNFLRTYNELLRDTGRYSCEDLIAKHLGQDITQVEFWR